MEDIHQLMGKFDAIAKELEQKLAAQERRQAASLGPLATPEAIEAALRWHEHALADVSSRAHELDTQIAAVRDAGGAPRLGAIRAELALEVAAIQQAIDALRQRLDAPPTATR